MVVSLFDKTGNAVRPWREAGYDCLIVDIQHPAGFAVRADGIRTLGCDLRNGIPDVLPTDGIAFVFAFPPCDHLAVSGARWFKGKGLRALALSVDLFATAAEYCEATGAPYLIENPVSTISTYWRKPDHTFHPHEYTLYEPRDNYTKTTCVRCGGGFVMPPSFSDVTLGPPDDRIHKMPPSANRADLRSATPVGFSRAVFNHNAVADLL